jgi:cytochrome oxidase Cu insertion factor (SCO1/SenC/PrrC family)
MTEREGYLQSGSHRTLRSGGVVQVATVAFALWLTGAVPAQGADPLAAMGVVTAERGREAPEFTLPDAEGKRWALRKQRGRPVVLTFFTTW